MNSARFLQAKFSRSKQPLLELSEDLNEAEPLQWEVATAHGTTTVHVYNAECADTVVMVHGCGGKQAQWREGRMAQRLAARFRVVTFDLYGHSVAPACPHYTKESFLEQLEAVVAAAAGRGPLHLYGFSMGCFLAAHFAHRHPQMVARLVLHSPWSADLRALAPGVGAAARVPGLGLLGCAAVRRLWFPHCHSARTLRQIVTTLGEGPGAWGAVLEGLARAQHGPERVLLICGGAWELPFLRVARAAHRTLHPKSELRSFAGAAHMSWCFHWDREVGRFFRDHVWKFLNHEPHLALDHVGDEAAAN